MTMTDETTTNSDEYNGWTNRETWAANLWVSNDKGFYLLVKEWAEYALDHFMEEEDGDTAKAVRAAVGNLADQLKEYWSELVQDVTEGEPTNKELRMMVQEVGSLWRVDWLEIAEAWVQDAMEARDDG